MCAARRIMKLDNPFEESPRQICVVICRATSYTGVRSNLLDRTDLVWGMDQTFYPSEEPLQLCFGRGDYQLQTCDGGVCQELELRSQRLASLSS